jgi:hypothetical protein
MGVAATVAIEAGSLGGWYLGVVGLSELDSAIVGGASRDLTPDVRITEDVQLEYGIQGTGPTDRIASTGTLTFTLNNMANNSAGAQGAFSPGHTNAIAGWDIGVPVWLKITYDGTTYYKFNGTVIGIEPLAGQYRTQAVRVTAVDFMDDLARARVRNVTIQENKRADELIDTLVTNSVSREPDSTSLAEGQSTFKVAFDNLLDAQTTVLRAIADCTLSELGYCYVKGGTAYKGGILTFEDRHARPKTVTPAATFDNTMVELVATRNREDLINRIYVVVHPRTTDGSVSVLFELTSTNASPEIPAGQTITINCPFKESSINAYRVAAESLVTPVSGSDYIANSASDASGTNLTSDIVLTVSTEAANSCELTITNNAAVTAYLTTLQIRGTAVRDVSETVMSATNAVSSSKYGEIDKRVDMIYESRAGEYGNEIANWLLNIYKDARYVIQEFSISSNDSAYNMEKSLALEPGSLIAFNEAMTGIATTGTGGATIGYFINGVRMTISKGSMITTSWVLQPASAQAAWVLDTSQLDVNTNLGFA